MLYNLNISHIEVRSEEDEEVLPYTHLKQIECIKCFNSNSNSNKGFNSSSQGSYILKQLHNLMLPAVAYLCDKNVLLTDKPDSLSSFILDDAQW